MKARIYELLADEAANELDAAGNEELERLLEGRDDIDRDAMMHIASLTQAAFLRRDLRAQQAMPAGIKEKILEQARRASRRNRPLS